MADFYRSFWYVIVYFFVHELYAGFLLGKGSGRKRREDYR